MSGLALVTGAGGFVGGRLCQRLKMESGIRALLRSPRQGPWQESAVADLGSSPLPAGLMDGVEVVYHVAGRAHMLKEAGENADAFHRVNAEGTRQLYQAALAAGVSKFVLVSSVAALADGGEGVIAEDATPAPSSAYGQSKLEAERVVMGDERVAQPVVLRFPLIYGPSAPGNLDRMVAAVRSGRFPPVPRIANRRSMIHVDDAVSAMLLACYDPVAAGRTYTVTDGHGYSTRFIYEAILEALGKTAPGWSVPAGLLRGLARIGDVAGAATGRRWPFDSVAYDKLFGSAEYECAAIGRETGFEPEWELARAMPEIVAAGVRG